MIIIVKNNANAGDLRNLAQIVLEGRIKTFYLELRKTNKSKTKLYVEYTTYSEIQLNSEDREMRLKISELLENIAESIECGCKFNSINITKSLTTDWQTLIDRTGSHVQTEDTDSLT